jgi:hypothetical protein
MSEDKKDAGIEPRRPIIGPDGEVTLQDQNPNQAVPSNTLKEAFNRIGQRTEDRFLDMTNDQFVNDNLPDGLGGDNAFQDGNVNVPIDDINSVFSLDWRNLPRNIILKNKLVPGTIDIVIETSVKIGFLDLSKRDKARSEAEDRAWQLLIQYYGIITSQNNLSSLKKSGILSVIDDDVDCNKDIVIVYLVLANADANLSEENLFDVLGPQPPGFGGGPILRPPGRIVSDVLAPFVKNTIILPYDQYFLATPSGAERVSDKLIEYDRIIDSTCAGQVPVNIKNLNLDTDANSYRQADNILRDFLEQQSQFIPSGIIKIALMESGDVLYVAQESAQGFTILSYNDEVISAVPTDPGNNPLTQEAKVKNREDQDETDQVAREIGTQQISKIESKPGPYSPDSDNNSQYDNAEYQKQQLVASGLASEEQFDDGVAEARAEEEALAVGGSFGDVLKEEFTIDSDFGQAEEDTRAEIGLTLEQLRYIRESTKEYIRVDSLINRYLSNRNKHYMMNWRNISLTDSQRVSWREFVEAYVIDPVPEIIVDPEGFSGQEDFQCSATQQALSKYGDSLLDSINCLKETAGGFATLADELDSTVKSVKNIDEVIDERVTLSASELESKVKYQAEQSLTNISDSLVRDVDVLVENINNLDQVFENLLNRISISSLIDALVGACFPGLEITCIPLKLPKVPSLDFPTIPTVDILADISVQVYKLLVQVLTDIFITLITEIINWLLSLCTPENCNNPEIPLNDIVNDVLNGRPETKGKTATAKKKALEAVCDLDELSNSPDEMKKLLLEVNGLIADLGLVLTTYQICRLFEGKYDINTMDLIRAIISNKYPILEDCFDTNDKIAAFFNNLGDILGPSFCVLVSELPEEAGARLDECKELPEVEQEFANFKELLKNRKKITGEELDRLIENAKKREEARKKRLKAIRDIFAKNDQGGNAMEDIMNELLSNDQCFDPDGNNSSIVKSAIDHPAIDQIQSMGIESVLRSHNQFFNFDLKNMYDNALIREVEVEEKIKPEVKIPGVGKITHPRVLALQAQGVDIEEIKEEGKKVSIYNSLRTAAPSARENLKSLDSAEQFSINLVNDAISYEIEVPNNPEVVKGIQSFSSSITDLINNPDINLDLGAFSDFQLPDSNTLFEVLPRWSVKYQTPFVEEGKQTTQDLEDEYIIKVEALGTNDRFGSLSVRVRNPIDDSVLNYIKDLDISTSPISIKLYQGPNKTNPVSFLCPSVNSVFGRFAAERFTRAIRFADKTVSLPTSALDKFSDNISKFFSVSVHGQVARDMFGLIAEQVSDSVLFDGQKNTYGAAGLIASTSSVPYISSLDFTRGPTDNERACNFIPHPLKTDCFKKEIVDNLKATRCDTLEEFVNVDGLSKGPNPLERGIIDAIVKMTFRTYAFDYMSRAIFLLTDFRIQDSVDDYLLEFCSKKMISELRNYGKSYYEGFTYKAYELYAEAVALPTQKTTDRGKVEKTRENLTLTDRFTAIKYILKQSIESVSSDMRDTIEKSLPEGAVPRARRPRRQLVNDWLPVIDLPNTPGEPRFSPGYSKTLLQKTKKPGVFTIRGKKIDLENGNFLLEKYYKLERLSVEKILDNFNEGSALTGLAMANTFDKAWEVVFEEYGGEPVQYLSIEEYSKAIQDIWQKLKEKTFELGLKPTNTSATKKYFSLDSYFMEIRPGLRMVYLLPTKTGSGSIQTFNLDGLEDKVGTRNVPNIEGYFGGQTYFKQALKSIDSFGTNNTSENNFKAALKRLRNSQKSYSVFERFLGKEREIYMLPLVDTSICAGDSKWWSQNKNKQFQEVLPGQAANADTSEIYWKKEYKKVFSSLKRDIINSDEYDLLFDYIFPLDRYLSMVAVYTIMSVSSMQDVETAFDGIKDRLYATFRQLENGISHSDRFEPTNEQVSFVLDQFSYAFRSPCFSFAFSAVPPNMKGFGLDILKKIAIQIPIFIFKAFVEQFDPNIKFAKFIQEILTALGVCLPLPLISIGLLPPTIFGYPPIGFGIGPVLTPFGFAYLALGFSSLFTDLLPAPKQTDDEKGAGLSCDPSQLPCVSPLY